MEPLKDKEGKVWKPYLMGYETENAKFVSIFYAISKEHAALVVEDIKDTAILVGEIRKREDFL
jgi:hypothetical protein